MRFTSFFKLTALLAVALFAVGMMAQSIVTGDLAGTITDPSNAVVSGATVTLTSVDTNAAQTTKTNSTGFYRFPLMKPGNYKVSVSQSGFRTTVSQVAIEIGQVNTLNLQLQIGQGSETVEVTGAAPLIQTEDANIATSYTQSQLSILPAPGGDITSYAYTAPGVVVSNGAGYGNFSAFGLPSTANLFTTNGNDNMDPFLNLNNSGASNLTLGSNELQEIAVVSNGYTAQYGRQAGLQENASTKSGSNAIHGNAIFNYNSSILNANDWFSIAGEELAGQPNERPKAVNRQWAWSVGGPIMKNKLFFFVDQEGLRMVLPGVSGTNYVPSAAFATYVEGNVPAAALPFYQNAFGLYAGAVGARSPIAAATDPNLGCGDFSGTAGFGAGGTPCADQFFSAANNLITEWILAARVDFKINSSDTLFGRYHMDRGVQATGTDPINPVFNATSIQPEYDGQLNETHVFNSTTINNFILSGTWYKALFGPPSYSAAIALFPTDLSFNDGAPYTQLAPTYGYPQGRIVTQYQVTDDFSKSWGAHDIKVGVNFRRNLVSDYSALSGTAGNLVINSMTEFANGMEGPGGLSSYTANYANVGAVQLKLYSLGTYIQDQWKVTSKLNLTFALRIDRNANPTCKQDCFARLISPFANLSHDVNVPYNQAIQTNISHAFPDVEKAVASPRFGFAYNIKPNTVIRGGFGIFDDLFPSVLVDRFLTNSPNVNNFTIGNGDPSVAGQLLAPVPGSIFATANTANATFQSQFKNGITFAGLGHGFNYYSMGTNLLNPKFAEWNLELQQSLGARYSIGLNYAGNHGYDTMSINPFLNAACVGCNPGQQYGGLIGTTPADQRFGEMVDLNNQGYSNYNGLTATFKMQPVHGFSGNVNYTWSHGLDICSNNCVEPYVANTDVSLRYQVSPVIPGRAYGNSDYDVRHNFNLNYVYQTPNSWSNKAEKYALGGWVFGGTLFYHTGIPWSPVDTHSRANLENVTGLRNGTPLATYAGGVVPHPNCGTKAAQSGAGIATGVPCITGDAFAIGTLGFGNAARNSQRGPGFFDTDLSITKNFDITERIKFGIGANIFDILNHQNFDLPYNLDSSGAFGSILSTIGTNTNPYGAFFGVPLNGRIMQVNAKVTF